MLITSHLPTNQIQLANAYSIQGAAKQLIFCTLFPHGRQDNKVSQVHTFIYCPDQSQNAPKADGECKEAKGVEETA